MKYVTKSLSLILAFLMLTSLATIAPITANAETSGDYSYSIIVGGTAQITGYLGSDTHIEIPDELGGKKVTTIKQYAFSHCTSLESVVIPDGVTDVGEYAFLGCTNLKSVTIPKSVTSIGDDSFWGCENLNSVSVDSDNETYSSLNGDLYTKDQTTLLQYSPGKTEESFTIPSGVSIIANWAFYNCLNLKSVTIPSNVTHISASAFIHCTGLTEVTIPGSVVIVGEYAFSTCTGIKNVTIEDGVTVLSDYAFNYCTSLTNITIPKSVDEIGVSAFSDCESLKNVYYAGSESDWKAISIGENNEFLESAKIYYNTTEPLSCEHAETKTVGAKSPTYFAKGCTGDKICVDCGEVVEESKPIAVKVLKTPKVKVKSAKKAIKVTYKKVNGANGFVLSYVYGKKTYKKSFSTTNSATIRITNLKSGKKCTVKVKAYTTSGSKKAYSKWTKATAVKVK